MHCLQCGGSFEYAGPNKEHARCTKCLALHAVVRPGHVQLMDVRAPNGMVDPEFTAIFAQQLGFAPRKPEVHVVGAGPVNLVVNTGRMERDIRNKISGMIWGWIIGGIILAIMAIGGIVLYFYVRGQMNAATADVQGAGAGAGGSPSAPQVVSWDGKSPYSCGASQVVTIKGTTANLTSGPAVSALGACQLTLENVNITAPDGVQAMGTAKVTINGGSIKSTGEAINAMGNAQVTVNGAKVTGKTSTHGAGAKITGVK
jgi:hypothetical protein